MISIIFRFSLLLTLLFFPACTGENSDGRYEAVEPQKFHWRMQSQSSKSGLEFQALKEMAEKIEIVTDGRFSITVYQKNLLADRFDLFERIKNGQIEMGIGQPGWWEKIDFGWAAIDTVPFNFANLDASMMFFLEGEGTALANQMSEQHRIIWRPAWWSGMESGVQTTFPARYLSDFIGKRIAMKPGFAARVFEKASGAKTMEIPPGDIHSALRDGKIQGVEWQSAATNWQMRFHRLCDYQVGPALWQPAVMSDLLINQEAYEKLPYAYQILLETSLRELTIKLTMAAKIKDIEATRDFLKFGTTIAIWTMEDIRRFKKAYEEVRAEYAEKSYTFRRIMEFKNRFKVLYDQHYQFHRIYLPAPR